MVTTLAGTATAGSASGIGTSATFTNPAGLAINPAGTELYLSDQATRRIRKVNLLTGNCFVFILFISFVVKLYLIYLGTVSNVAGATSDSSSLADGIGIATKFYNVMSLAFNAAGNQIYVSDGSQFSGSNTNAMGGNIRVITIA